MWIRRLQFRSTAEVSLHRNITTSFSVNRLSAASSKLFLFFLKSLSSHQGSRDFIILSFRGLWEGGFPVIFFALDKRLAAKPISVDQRGLGRRVVLLGDDH